MKTSKYYPTTVLNHSKKLLVAASFFAASFTSLSANAQKTSYQSIPVTSTVKVLGNSNIHKWNMNNERLASQAAFTFKDGKLSDLSGFSFTMQVKDLKSDEELLNSRAHKALNAEKYTTITFKMTSATVAPTQGNNYQIKAYGKLQIAGVTKDVMLLANAIQNADKTISCSGTEKLKMSDYGIKPPTFMLGALKVADEVNINFNLKFKD
jgi:polyisoprenoid-binding protein YceI